MPPTHGLAGRRTEIARFCKSLPDVMWNLSSSVTRQPTRLEDDTAAHDGRSRNAREATITHAGCRSYVPSHSGPMLRSIETRISLYTTYTRYQECSSCSRPRPAVWPYLEHCTSVTVGGNAALATPLGHTRDAFRTSLDLIRRCVTTARLVIVDASDSVWSKQTSEACVRNIATHHDILCHASVWLHWNRVGIVSTCSTSLEAPAAISSASAREGSTN